MELVPSMLRLLEQAPFYLKSHYSKITNKA